VAPGRPPRETMSVSEAGKLSAVSSRDAEPLPGLRWRILASIIGPISWLVFTLLYVGFWAAGFSLFQSVIVVLVSILILGGVMGVLWTAWGSRYRGRWGWEG
jgi:hypothetical protein